MTRFNILHNPIELLIIFIILIIICLGYVDIEDEELTLITFVVIVFSGLFYIPSMSVKYFSIFLLFG